MKAPSKNIDTYLKPLPDAEKASLQKLRQLIHSLAPGAEEVISYGLPAFRYHGRVLVGFGAFKKHLAFFPWGGGIVEMFQQELDGFSIAKGTIRFTPSKPIPPALLKKMIKTRIKQNLEKLNKQ